MKLYLLRHASAQELAATDDARELTAQGKEEARTTGQALAKLGVRPGHIFCSPLVRARQTAALVADALQFTGTVEAIDELKNGVSTAALLRAIKPCAPAAEILLVGHMPSLAEHLAALLGATSAEAFPIGKAGVACVELQQWQTGSGRLHWLMRQTQLTAMLRPCP